MPEVVTVFVVDRQQKPVLSACALVDPQVTLAELGATAEALGIDKLCAGAYISEELACRGCGCTDDNACITENGPCHWVEPDLCSACATRVVLRP